jgi:hypothetical protein
MPIDRFTVADFEAALPHDKKKDNEAIFAHIGLIDGEHCWAYEMCRGHMRILVRSSIDNTGHSADTGEDSIRLVIQQRIGTGWRSCGKGADAYTTRVPGWQGRLKGKIRDVFERTKTVKLDPIEGEVVYFTKQGVNKGRPFAQLNGSFNRWLDK